MRYNSDRFDNYLSIKAKFASTGVCGHPIEKGDPIGWNRIAKKTQCADCWRKWQAENAEAAYLERCGL